MENSDSAMDEQFMQKDQKSMLKINVTQVDGDITLSDSKDMMKSELAKSHQAKWDNTLPIQPDVTQLKRDGLTQRTQSAYAVSHFSNDLCASAWFTYVLYYVTTVVLLDSTIAGFVMLSGQIADGLTTPLVGFYSDKTDTKCGKRQPWYIVGTILVIPSFFALFAYPHLDPGSSQQIAYYIILPAIFNVGWASVQISTMAIVNSLTFSTQRRDKLISLRNGFSYLANFVVLGTALLIFAVYTLPGQNDYQVVQIKQFRLLAFIIIILGTITSLFYIFNINEIFLTKEAKRYDKEYKNATEAPSMKLMKKNALELPENSKPAARQSVLSEVVMDWKGWLREGSFYIHGLVYMLVRVAVNVTMSVMPFYLLYVCEFQQTPENPTPLPIALVPLVQYTCSLIFSLFFYKKMIQKFKNRLLPLVVSIFVIVIGSVPLMFLNGNTSTNWIVYICAGIQGVGLAIMLNTATSLISDVIGKHESSSAFVYGAYSFADKVMNGILLFVITDLWLNAQHAAAIKYITALTPIITSCLACLFTYIGRRLYADRMARLTVAASHKLMRNQVEDLMKDLNEEN